MHPNLAWLFSVDAIITKILQAYNVLSVNLYEILGKNLNKFDLY